MTFPPRPTAVCIWSAAALLMIAGGCSMNDYRVNDYKATVQSASKAIPSAVQMETLFPDIDHFITNYGSDASEHVWNSEAYFGGRYYLTMQVSVKVNYATHKVRQVGEPKFYLKEFGAIGFVHAGVYEGTVSRDFRFGLDEWNQVVAAQGDLAAIGFTCKSDTLPLFADQVASVRRDRIPVRLLQNTGTASTAAGKQK